MQEKNKGLIEQVEMMIFEHPGAIEAIEGCLLYLLFLVVLVLGLVGFMRLWNAVMAWVGGPALPVVTLWQMGAVVFMLCIVAPAIVMVLMALIAMLLDRLNLR